MKTLVGTLVVVALVFAADVFAQSTYYVAGTGDAERVTCVGTPTMNAQGRVTSCTLAQDTDSHWGPGTAGKVYCKGGAVINFNAQGRVPSCTLAQSTTAHWTPGETRPVYCKGGAVINFDAQGGVSSCTLAQDTTAHWAPGNAGPIFCKAGAVINFNAQGRVSSCAGRPHVVVAADGTLHPAPGYRWVSDDPADRRVIWNPGKRHTQHPNVVARATEGRWEPAPGYRWVNDEPGDMRVIWTPGKPHAQHPNVVARTTEGRWEPAPGYRWVNDEAGDMRVVREVATGESQTGTPPKPAPPPSAPPKPAPPPPAPESCQVNGTYDFVHEGKTISVTLRQSGDQLDGTLVAPPTYAGTDPVRTSVRGSISRSSIRLMIGEIGGTLLSTMTGDASNDCRSIRALWTWTIEGDTPRTITLVKK